jgi:hypothetical protein
VVVAVGVFSGVAVGVPVREGVDEELLPQPAMRQIRVTAIVSPRKFVIIDNRTIAIPAKACSAYSDRLNSLPH